MITRSALRVGVAMVVWLLFAAALAAQAPSASEYDVKAAYLFNFSKFIQWPASVPDATFDICIIGSDPFGASLQATVGGETAGNRPIRVHHVDAGAEPLGCHILFVNRSVEPRVAALLQRVGTAPTLTVSDMPQFVNRGGMIQFVTQGGKVRFEINLPVAQKAGLALSSELLRVASAVRQNP